MLDSLARFSRRVGAFTDLLGREQLTATEALLAVQVSHRPLESGARTPGANTGVKTSSQAFGPDSRVPTITPSRDAPVDRASTREPVIADQTPRAAPTLGWVHWVNFEEGSVYHHTVSRTLNSRPPIASASVYSPVFLLHSSFFIFHYHQWYWTSTKEKRKGKERKEKKRKGKKSKRKKRTEKLLWTSWDYQNSASE